MARREEGGYPQRSLTDEQRSQRAVCSKTLRAAGLLCVAGVGSAVTARFGDGSGLVALATAKIPRRRTPRHFQTGSNNPQ